MPTFATATFELVASASVIVITGLSGRCESRIALRPIGRRPSPTSTHVFGVMEHGLKYFKHFLGPVWWLAPLMLPIELVSHIARPLSLTLRLLGNMAADHKVVSSFFALVPLIVPVPFLILGVMVVIVQTLVFCLLSMVYIQGAVTHEGHGDDDHHGHEEHAHEH